MVYRAAAAVVAAMLYVATVTGHGGLPHPGRRWGFQGSADGVFGLGNSATTFTSRSRRLREGKKSTAELFFTSVTRFRQWRLAGA